MPIEQVIIVCTPVALIFLLAWLTYLSRGRTKLFRPLNLLLSMKRVRRFDLHTRSPHNFLGEGDGTPLATIVSQDRTSLTAVRGKAHLCDENLLRVDIEEKVAW